MPINDYKEITVPVNGTDKAVKKIEDSNGNIIWGSQSAFPYRRLEYIDMTGNYIDTLMRPTAHFYFLDVKFNDLSNPLVNSSGYAIPWGCAGNQGGTAQRLFFDITSSKINQRIKTNGETLVANLSDLDTDTLYEFRCRAYFDNNTVGRWWMAFGKWDPSWSQIYGQYYNNSTYSMNLAYNPYINLNRHCTKSASNTNPTANNVYYQAGNGKFKIYRYYIKEDTDSSTNINNMFPCQRKSDGVCGLYDTLNSTFYPCQGNNTTTCGGPVADEYWDLTAPA